MPTVPTVPGYAQVQTPGASVKRDFNALDQPNQAQRNKAGALMNVADALAGFGEKLRGAVNYGIAADADRQMRLAAAEFQQSRVGRTDEDQWEAEWMEKADEVWSGIQSTHRIAPGLRMQLTSNFRDWKQANAIEVRTMANRQQINRAVDRVGLAADEAARDGDENGINVAFDGAVANELILPEVAEKMKQQYLTRIDEYAAKNYILTNPAGAVDFIGEKTEDGKYANLTRLTPDQRLTLLNTAKIQFTKYQEQNYQALIEGLQNGDVQTPEMLSGLVEQGVISPRQRKSYETAYRHGNFNTSVDDMGALFTLINEYDPDNDPKFTNRAKLMAEIATSGFPKNVQQEMNQLLGEKMDPENVLNSAVSKDAFQAIDQRFRLGLYGKYENRVEQPDGTFKTIVNPKVYESAMTTKRRIEDATRKYLRENPKASAEELNDFISDVQMTNVVRSGRSTILNTVVPGNRVFDMTPAQRKAQLDLILEKANK